MDVPKSTTPVSRSKTKYRAQATMRTRMCRIFRMRRVFQKQTFLFESGARLNKHRIWFNTVPLKNVFQIHCCFPVIMRTKRLARAGGHGQGGHTCSSVCMLPIEIWLIIGSLVEENLQGLASTCLFLSEILYPLLYRDIICLTLSILLNCGTAWLNRPTFIFPHAKTLTIGVSFDNAGRFQYAMERSGLLGKWRSFTPILARFSNLTHLEFIFLVLPRTFPVVLSALPKMTNLVLKSCVFDGPVSFYGVELRLLHLTLHNICWDESPDEGNLLQGCPLLRVLFLSWHYRIAHTLDANRLRKLLGTLYDLTVSSAKYSWSTDRQHQC